MSKYFRDAKPDPRPAEPGSPVAASAQLSQESLHLLAEASAAINSTLDLKTVLDNIAASAAKVMQAEAGSVLLHDKPRSKLIFVSATGERAEMVIGREFDADLGIAGRVATTGRPEIVPDVQTDRGFYRKMDEISSFETRTMMAAPMITDEEVIGVVEVLNRVDGEFGENDLELLMVFANLAAISARNAKTHERLKQQHRDLCDQVLRGHKIIGDSKPIKDVIALCSRVAPSDASVLLLGETGTGKELFSKFIHNTSSRADEPFVAVNCAALTETLLESELFGHEKGAFTGAVSLHVGRFETADGGTIFLDEIGEIPLSTQVKLLRVLQEHAFERVGGSATVRCDVRVIAATNRDLKAEALKGAFREDLFYRLNVFPVQLPPLRQRRDDIPRLVDYFAAQAAEKMSLPAPRLTPDASAVLISYDWPGNVRELQNIMERAVILSHDEPIDVTDLPVEITGTVDDSTHSTSSGSLWDFERSMIVKALKDHGWNQTQAARALGISRDNLRYRVKKYKITKDD